jgi:general secretion pathway protein B
MSFILDALRKAEHERKLGQPPDLSSPPPLPGPSGTPPSRRRLVGLIVLVLGLVVLALLVWPRDPSPEPIAEPVAPAAPPAAAPAPVPVPAPTLPPPQDEPVVEDGEELPAPLDGDADLASLDELVDDSSAATEIGRAHV